MRAVYVAGADRWVSLTAYVCAVKLAKANPEREFFHSLNGWWPATGREVVRQFRAAMHARISEAIPYHQRGAGASSLARNGGRV